ncbi:MAG: hypothetical protein JNN22_08520 [Rhodospirillales bacterium]|nr:hypothetical protein [Rhodospirillales bacterium]
MFEHRQGPQRGCIPVVTAPPPPGYTLRQRLPLDAIRAACVDVDEIILIDRRLYGGGKLIERWEQRLELRAGEWLDAAPAAFDLESPVDEAQWGEGKSLPFLETLLVAERGRGFRSIFAPSFYTVFDSDRLKSFFNDNALKYANTVVIRQIEAFKAWVEGYPVCEIDRARDLGQSVILINPHERPAVVSISLEGLEKPRKVKVDAMSSCRVDFAQMLGADRQAWRGQAFVWGPNRVNMFFVYHGLAEPNSIVTMEHSEVYRGEHGYVPWLGELLRKSARKRPAPASIE